MTAKKTSGLTLIAFGLAAYAAATSPTTLRHAEPLLGMLGGSTSENDSAATRSDGSDSHSYATRTEVPDDPALENHRMLAAVLYIDPIRLADRRIVHDVAFCTYAETMQGMSKFTLPRQEGAIVRFRSGDVFHVELEGRAGESVSVLSYELTDWSTQRRLSLTAEELGREGNY